jgi:hypothetical protein
VDSSFVSFFAPVAQSSEEHSAFQLNLRDSYWPDGSGGVPERSELGGISGGPIFRYHSGPIEFLELAGFIYEACAQFELIRGRHASVISAFGEFTCGAKQADRADEGKVGSRYTGSALAARAHRHR